MSKVHSYFQFKQRQPAKAAKLHEDIQAQANPRPIQRKITALAVQWACQKIGQDWRDRQAAQPA